MPNKIETTLMAINGNQDFAIIVGKSDVFQYENGQRTSKERVGVRLNLALQGNKLTPISARIDGADPLPDLTDEHIAETCRQRKFLYVKLIEPVVSIYTINNNINMTATAKGAEIIGNNSK